jgi:hypothetical protein
MANGLITKQTDLKSLKYSSMPLGSQSPYITKNIGQAPGSQIGREVQSRIDDTSRIAQMLIDKPGIKYLLNEALLQQTNIQDKIQKAKDKGKTLGGAILQQLGSTAVNTVKIAASTLAQVPVNGTGTHFVKGFRTDTYLQPTNGNQRSGFAQFFGAGGVEGAPLALKGQPIEGQVESNFYDPNVDYIADSPEVKPIQSLDLSKTTNQYLPKATVAEAADGIILDAFIGTGIDPLNRTYLEQEKQLNTVVETTLTSGSIGRSNQTAGTVTSGEINIKPFEQSGYEAKRRSKLSTEDNIRNALTGSAIALSGPQSETTVTPGAKQNLIKGSVSNKDIKYDLDDNGVNTGKQYTPANTYTGKTAKNVIGNALTGAPIQVSSGSNDGIHPNNTTYAPGTLPGGSKNSQTIKGSKKQQYVEPVRKYSEGDTYLAEQKDRKIGNSTKNVIRERRVGLGDQSIRNKAGVNYWTAPTEDELDKINYIDVTTDRPEGVGVGRDLAKLYFEIITPDAKPRFLYFRAFIDSFDDSFNADWQGHKYVSRAEDFYTYGGFSRDINLSFKVAAATRAEMKPLYKKMVYLASATAPTYGGMMTKYMRGTLARMTVGSYLDQVPGVITSVKYNLIEDMPWEIAMGQPEGVEPESQVLPMGLACSVVFKPIHDFAPQTGLYPYFTNANEEPRYFTEQDAVLT